MKVTSQSNLYTLLVLIIFIEHLVACGEHGDHSRKLVNAIENGKRDIRSETDFEKVKVSNGKHGGVKSLSSSHGKNADVIIPEYYNNNKNL